jgi:hypothetical protein
MWWGVMGLTHRERAGWIISLDDLAALQAVNLSARCAFETGLLIVNVAPS